MELRFNELGRQLTSQNYSLDSFAAWLTSETHSTVTNKTGITGRYDIALQWSEDLRDTATGEAPYPTIFTALQEQLGLKLEPAKVAVETVVIDHIEKPSEN